MDRLHETRRLRIDSIPASFSLSLSHTARHSEELIPTLVLSLGVSSPFRESTRSRDIRTTLLNHRHPRITAGQRGMRPQAFDTPQPSTCTDRHGTYPLFTPRSQAVTASALESRPSGTPFTASSNLHAPRPASYVVGTHGQARTQTPIAQRPGPVTNPNGPRPPPVRSPPLSKPAGHNGTHFGGDGDAGAR